MQMERSSGRRGTDKSQSQNGLEQADGVREAFQSGTISSRREEPSRKMSPEEYLTFLDDAHELFRPTPTSVSLPVMKNMLL